MVEHTLIINFIIVVNHIMSSNSAPISPARFAAALSSLPLPNLHLKAAEIRNSITHLEYSNLQLQPLTEEGDRDCKEAVEENRETIARMEERIALLKAEVERRGSRLSGDEGHRKEEANGGGGEEVNAQGDIWISEAAQRVASSAPANGRRVRAEGGRRGDEELARRLRERIEEDNADDDENGLYL